MAKQSRNVPRRSSNFLAALVALAVVVSPGLAEARLGGGGSFGSRGGMTWSAPPATRTAPNSGAPMQRSVTPNNPSPGYATGGSGYGYGPRSGFMSGLLGGLIGAGIGGLLLGHGFFGGMLGFGGFLGFLLQIFLIVLVARWLIRMFSRSSRPAFAGGPSTFARTGAPLGMGGSGGSGGSSTPPPIQIGPQDYQAFEQVLRDTQAAWSRHDLNALSATTTPEMLSYFSEQLSEQASQGVRNEVTDVRLLQGDLAQAWREGSREYATVAMRFSMIDVTRDRTGRIVDGSPNEHVTATELWTFVRSSGGQWILSAIQQAR
ncbi:MAG TPA: TIM44-like domain-containing protein [Acetobacteraceae bacterium]|jgi:predicted lipid-binding transport protein (Tim44 family)|nr:TIM44-like domain-containing protein [Acetobacteraceae bacterium]